MLIMFISAFFQSTKAQYTKLLDFVGASNGSRPAGSLISDGTFLYGMGWQGGTNNKGVIFKIKTDGTGYSKLLDFAGTNGSYPYGELISDGTFLYGMAGGGTSTKGVIFKIKPDGTGYSKLLDFTGAANGSYPDGSLIFDGTYLYGMTEQGGTGTCSGMYGCGVIFKIKPDGTGYSKLLDFTGAANGRQPYGSLISDGTYLYGMTNKGGINDSGTVFKIMPDGTGYSKLLDFTGAANGSFPYNSLIYDGTDLYGMTYKGGVNNYGVVFKIKPDGTGYSKLLDFAGITNGGNPMGSFFFDGTFLYGTTLVGGTDSLGTIFKIKADGSDYNKLLDFSGVVNGSYPSGSLISDGTFLYGMTNNGGMNTACGIYGCGTVFKLSLVATGIVDNNKSKEFNVYPNPSNGTFTIETKESNYMCIITNVLGKIVYQSKIGSQKSEIDLGKQPNGIYFANIKTEKETTVQKLIINK